jgi:hypothetical protein
MQLINPNLIFFLDMSADVCNEMDNFLSPSSETTETDIFSRH